MATNLVREGSDDAEERAYFKVFIAWIIYFLISKNSWYVVAHRQDKDHKTLLWQAIKVWTHPRYSNIAKTVKTLMCSWFKQLKKFCKFSEDRDDE